MNEGEWARVVSVFERARGLPADEVQLLLDETLAGEAGLAREVQDLLAADQVDFPLLDGTRPPIGGPASGAEPAAPAVTMPNELGPYRLLGELGRGGMGVVYLAERDDVELRVALKLLPRGSASEEGLRRFEYERRVLARLEHPSIARLMDAGITDDGSPWFAMEYVRGQPIDIHCDIHQYTVAQRLDLIESVGRAVAYAHRNLIIHRDLKPSNVLVNGAGVPKLVDFGIAKLLHHEAEDGGMTRADARVMTPNYASPEQIQGTVLTTASDVYQLGILAHELLVGVRPRGPAGQPMSPWSRERPLAPSELLAGPYPGGAGAVKEVAMRRSTTPAALESELRGDLDHVVLKALEPDADDRYPAAQQLVEDLERYRIGHPVRAHPGSFARRVWKAMARHRAVSLLGAAVAVVVAVSLVGFAYQAQRIARERDQAERAAAVLTSIVQRATPSVAGDSTVAVEVLEEARGEALAGLDQDPIRWGPIVLAIANAQRSGDPASAARLQQAVVDRLPEGHPAHLEAMSQLGTTLVESGDFDRGIPYLERAAEGARALPEERRSELGNYLADLGFGRQVEGELDEADALYREAQQMFSTLPDSGGDLLNRVLINRGYLIRAQGDEVAAEAFMRLALDRRTRDLGPDHLRTANAAAALAEVLLVRRNLALADTLSARALAVRQATHTDADGFLASSLGLRGRVVAALGRHGEGEELLRQSLAMGRQVYGEGPHIQLAFATVNLGLVLVQMGRVEEAVDQLRAGLNQYEQSVGPDHHAALSAAVELADAERARGRLVVAGDLMDRALPKLEALVSTGSRLAAAYVVQGSLLQDSGRCGEAVSWFTRAMDEGAAVWTADHPYAVRAKEGLDDCKGR